MIALIRFGLRAEWRSILYWALPMGILASVTLSAYNSFDAGQLTELTKQYPEALKQAFGLENLASVEGYMGAEFFSLVAPIAFSIFAARVSARLLAGAEEASQLSVLLASPLSRQRLFVAIGTTMAIMTSAVIATSVSIIAAADLVFSAGLSVQALVHGALALDAFALMAGAVALSIAGARGRASSAGALAIAFVFGSYTLQTVSALVPSLGWLDHLSVFHYYGTPLEDGLGAGLLVLVGLGLLCAAIGAKLFDRRDLVA